MSRADQRYNRGDARYVWGFIETRIMVCAAGVFGVALGFTAGWFTKLLIC